jgi:hypothetical protein
MKEILGCNEKVDVDEMRNIAEENASFVHIGVTVEREDEIKMYTSGV